jgi:uncharacterized protein YdhG (YjbR/CyaY superfamily)
MAPPKTVDAYLAVTPQPHRATLEKLRRDILAAAPFLEEVISYGMPTFKHGKGYGIVAFAASKNHCSLFPMSKAVGQNLGGAWLSGASTLQFEPDKPLPATMVKKIVKARLAENAVLNEARDARRKPPQSLQRKSANCAASGGDRSRAHRD